ncbi:MAG TPA: hypothetical protein VM537_15165, partial [Anaerolineae bacterium]|nr:hypothetical protein [Anaerolineae bacterium]
EQWGEEMASEDVPNPLLALASGSARGDIYISGGVNRNWRDWEEPMMELLAPFIQAGGSVSIDGEDSFRTNWVFDGECMTRDDEEYICCSRLQELEAKEKELEIVKARLAKAGEMLANHARAFRSLNIKSVAQEIEDFLKETPALEQLAECAE